MTEIYKKVYKGGNMTEKLLIPAIKNSLVKEWGGTIDDFLEMSLDSILEEGGERYSYCRNY